MPTIHYSRSDLCHLVICTVDEDTKECALICDEQRIVASSTQEIRSLIVQLQHTLDCLTDADLDAYSKAATLHRMPNMYPQVYGEDDPDWIQWLQNHPYFYSRCGQDSPKKSRSSQGFVYIVQCGTAAKIGCTTQLKKRLKVLTVKTPFPLKVLALLPSDDIYQLELLLHARFHAQRLQGEWFTLSAEDLVSVLEKFPTIDPAQLRVE